MISAIISRVIILIFGTLYPAYASYKAVRTKNVKEYVKWMMYWIVFAFFTCIETFTDIFLSWFPFYYEIKVLIVLWLLSPATKGSSTLYRKFVHPMLTRREPEIDEYINQAKEKGYTAVLQLGSKGVNYATNVIMQTALKGGGNLVQTIRRSYSLSDLSEPDDQRTQDEIDEVGRPQRLLRPRTQTARSSSGGRNVDMYFSEVDVGPKPPQPNFNYIRSSDDISSGYSSAEPVSTGLSRTASLTNATRPRFKGKRAEDEIHFESDEYEEMQNIQYPFQNILPSSYNLDSDLNKISRERLTSLQQLNTNAINELKSQAFLDNEKYLQDLLEQTIRKDELERLNKNVQANFQNVSDVQKEDQSILLKSKIEPNLNPISSNCIEHEPSKLERVDHTSTEQNSSPPKDMRESFAYFPELLASKYELFYKWLQENEKLKADELKNEESLQSSNKISSSQTDDEFLDPNNGSDEESFHDIESNSNPNEFSSDLISKSVKVSEELRGNLQKNISVKYDLKNCLENKVPIEADKSLPSILDDFNSSRKNSTLEEKRLPIHQKGRAPEPPSILSKPRDDILPSSISASAVPENTFSNLMQSIRSEDEWRVSVLNNKESKIEKDNISTDLPEIAKNLNAFKETQLSDDSQMVSRSPSPRLESKSKTGKINLFKSYLPSLFRPESPKPNNSTKVDKDDYPKETQI